MISNDSWPQLSEATASRDIVIAISLIFHVINIFNVKNRNSVNYK